MNTIHVLLVTCILLISCGFSEAFLSWIFGGHSESSPDTSASEGTTVGQRVPFEMKSADEKFLGNGRELMAGLSELDACHHTVVHQLKASCSDMTEEELAKLGVQLLNCQSKAEGRPTYQCTDDMTVAACTGGMDPNTWNAYHIVSNRARSVCYAVRQQQFQRQTQMAVNQLAMSAEGQLNLMEHLKHGQEELNSVASDTLNTVSTGQEKLLKTQEMLGASQSRLKVTVESNIRDLTREKALIAAGHQELASMTNSIRKQLDEATQQLIVQDTDRATNHKELLEDLSSLREKAQDVWQKLDDNVEYMQLYQDETAQHYQQTLENLARMNDTINYLLNMVDSMQTEINQQLGWVTSLLGWTGENLALMATCVSHACYFMLAAILVSFLQTPTFSRIVLLLIVPLNAVAEIKHSSSLPFPALSLFITTVVLVNWITLWIYSWMYPVKNSLTLPQTPGPFTPCRCSQSSSQGSPLYLPDFSHINGSPMSDSTFTMDPSSMTSFTSESGHPSTTTSRRLHSTGYTSILSDTVASILKRSDRKPSTSGGDTRRSASVGDVGADGDAGRKGVEDQEEEEMSSDDDVDITLSTTSGRTLTVTNLSKCDPTPMPDTHSMVGGGGEVDFGNITNTAKRHLGMALEDVTRATPSPSDRGRREGTPSSSRSSSPNRRPCGGQTKAGLPCRLPCMAGKDFCYRHVGTPIKTE